MSTDIHDQVTVIICRPRAAAANPIQPRRRAVAPPAPTQRTFCCGAPGCDEAVRLADTAPLPEGWAPVAGPAGSIASYRCPAHAPEIRPVVRRMKRAGRSEVAFAIAILALVQLACANAPKATGEVTACDRAWTDPAADPIAMGCAGSRERGR